MTVWQDITTAALLGTERQPFIPPAAPGALGALLARLPADPEAALLGAAAAVSLFQRAGTLPPVIDTPAPTPCPPETVPVCGPRVSEGIAMMLGGKQREALPEVLTALAGVGRRVPVPLLPDLLKRGHESKDLRAVLLPVLGHRGRWLAGQNHQWAWADQLLLETAGAPEQVWGEGSREARLSALSQLRQPDPARGLALLQSTWAAETAEDRAAFVDALDAGLSPDDEPFLESALEDRGKDVRRAAAERLARLPESAYARRMITRVQPLVVGKRILLGGFSLEVTLPADHDKSMERDGIGQQPPNAVVGYEAIGDKAWWLCQIIGTIPLDYWTQTWRRKPEEITEAADKTEWGGVLRRGWETAVRRWPDADWLSALLRGAPERTDIVLRRLAFQSALAAIPASGLERLILEQLRPQAHLFGTNAPVPLHDTHPALPLLQSHTQPWSAELSRAVVENVRRRMTAPPSKDVRVWQIPHALKRFAYFIPPALVTEFASGWPQTETTVNWQESVHEFLTTLQFRRDLLAAIARQPPPE